MSQVGSVTLHSHHIEGLTVNVERMTDIIGNAFVNQDDLDHIIEVHPKNVDAFAKFRVTTIDSTEAKLVAKAARIDVGFLSEQWR